MRIRHLTAFGAPNRIALKAASRASTVTEGCCTRRAFLLLVSTAVAFADSKDVSDDALFDNVRRRLASDPVVKGGHLDVDVKDGIVTLRGSVDLEKQKTQAEKAAKKVKGVKKVVNELQVTRR